MKILIVTAEPKNFVPVELQKAAGTASIPVEIVNVTDCVMHEHQDSSKVYYVTGDDEKKVEELIIDSDTVVIPRLSEHHLEVKLSLFKRMEHLGATILNSAESLELCNDKLMSQVVLNSAGIKTPSTIVFQDTEDMEPVLNFFEKSEQLKYPVILKTLRGTHGIGVMKIDSRSSLVSVGQTLLKEGIDFMIQEFIKHDQSARVIMLGNQLLAANLRGQPKEKDEFRTNSHLGSETEQYSPSEAELELAVKIIDLFKIKFCALDYIIQDGIITVLEVNGSPGLEGIQKDWPDRNLAAEVIAYVQNMLPQTGVAEPAPEASAVDPEPAKQEEPIAPTEPVEGEKPEEVLTDTELCVVHRIIDEPIEARIDTGAKYSSLHVDKFDVEEQSVKFKRGDVTYRVPLFKSIKIKNVHTNDSTVRPMIRLDITVKGQKLNQVEFTLNDRSNMKYQVLLGRTALERLGLMIKVEPTQASDKVTVDDVEEVEEE